MEFFINKGATLPILKLELIQDGRNDVGQIYELIQNSNIFFSMSDLDDALIQDLLKKDISDEGSGGYKLNK